ncbi:hypothetical protein [Nitrospira sp. Nam74]
MAQLGSRLFFYLLEPEAATGLCLGTGGTYLARLNECRIVVSGFLAQLFAQHRIRGIAWDSSCDVVGTHEQIAALATLLAMLRTIPSFDGEPPTPEAPMRAQAVLYNLARGHALVHARTHLTESDLHCLAQVTCSSIPRHRRQALLAFGQGSETLTVPQLQSAIGAKSDDKARKVMEDLDWLGVGQHQKAGLGKPSMLQLHKSWQWIAEPAFQSLLRAANLLRKGG